MIASYLLALCAITPANLREIDSTVLDRQDHSRMLADDVQKRMRAAAARENLAWSNIKTRADWEAFRDTRINALRDSLGPLPDPRLDLNIRTTRTIKGDGYTIDNIVFESRPGLLVTANLYRPAKPPAAKMPAFLISHSHHNPKTERELVDMGINWARLGCAVLVPDHIGHGERRQHPFTSADTFPAPFKPARQDYYFRYNASLQLHLAGHSLIGWMVGDLMRGIDVLLAQPNIDPNRIILIGAVAGGGDPAAVTAAIDKRIAAVIPFNFGGPQPDYAIPQDAERDFEYFGWPWWESTRCLRNSARDGFAHWTIVASLAPRRLIYAHEFSWERDRDPVFPRIQRVFEFTNAPDHLATAAGRGTLRGNSPEASHCNNVGALHRAALYPSLQKWFNIPAPAAESKERHPAADLMCLTPRIKPRLIHELLSESPPRHDRRQLRDRWAKLLGNIEPVDPKVINRRQQNLTDLTAGQLQRPCSLERINLEPEPGILIPLLLLSPQSDAKLPLVIAFSQAGKQRILRDRADDISELLSANIAVALIDLRGTGETAPKDRGRSRNAQSTTLSQSELMLGQTLLAARLRDLRSALRYLRTRADLDPARIALWGDSSAKPNPADAVTAAPLDANEKLEYAEPLGGLLTLLTMLFEDDIRAGYAYGPLTSYASCLHSPFIYIPHDAIIPGALTAGDLPDIAAAIKRPLHLNAPVNGLNQRIDNNADTAPAAWLLKALSNP